MDRNEQVARKLGWTRCTEKHRKSDGLHPGEHWKRPDGECYEFTAGGFSHPIWEVPDYVGDIALAMTLVPEKKTVILEKGSSEKWSARWGPKEKGRCDTLSAAIVDAFLKAG